MMKNPFLNDLSALLRSRPAADGQRAGDGQNKKAPSPKQRDEVQKSTPRYHPDSDFAYAGSGRTKPTL
jgi:hypothetical protein